MSPSLPPLPLPKGVSEHQVECPSVGLSFHILHAGYTPDRSKPLILLLHGFPELAFSWRKIIPSLASQGYYIVAPDQRGYGRTTGWDTRPFSSVDLSTFTMANLVRDMVALVHALGYLSVHCVIGHDFGAVSASMCALMRPDFFKSLVMMSHPFKGSLTLPFGTFDPDAKARTSRQEEKKADIHEQLAKLERPRKHYKWYNSTEPAASDWANPPQGLHAFLRGYFHLKSADWSGNDPHPLKAWTAEEVAKMPEYYIMPLSSSMPDVVSTNMAKVPEDEQKRSEKWLSDHDLAVYVQEWTRTGFQGGLNWYRSQTDPAKMKDMELFAGAKITVPSTFVSGEKDWGNYQEPGVVERMEEGETCTEFRGVRLIEGAGHWPQQEKPEAVIEEVLAFLGRLRGGDGR